VSSFGDRNIWSCSELKLGSGEHLTALFILGKYVSSALIVIEVNLVICMTLIGKPSVLKVIVCITGWNNRGFPLVSFFIFLCILGGRIDFIAAVILCSCSFNEIGMLGMWGQNSFVNKSSVCGQMNKLQLFLSFEDLTFMS